MKNVFFFLLTWGQVFTLSGQDKNTEPDSVQLKLRPHYFFSIRSGTLMGCRDCSYENEITFAASTVHGVKLRDRWGLGVGSGFHTFTNWQVIPFFASTSVDLNKGKNRLYLEFNYGYSRANLSPMAETEYGFKEAQGGRMVQPGIGYKIGYHDLQLAVLVAYQSQRVESRYEYPNQMWLNGRWVQGDANTRTLTNEFNRLLIQLVIGWR